MSTPNRLQLVVDQLSLSVTEADRLIQTPVWRDLDCSTRQVFLFLAVVQLQSEARRNDPGHRKGWAEIAPLPAREQDHALAEVRERLYRLVARGIERLLVGFLGNQPARRH
jgi:hypothetical protein